MKQSKNELKMLQEFAERQLPRKPWISPLIVTIKVPQQYAKMMLELAHDWEKEDREEGYL